MTLKFFGFRPSRSKSIQIGGTTEFPAHHLDAALNHFLMSVESRYSSPDFRPSLLFGDMVQLRIHDKGQASYHAVAVAQGGEVKSGGDPVRSGAVISVVGSERAVVEAGIRQFVQQPNSALELQLAYGEHLLLCRDSKLGYRLHAHCLRSRVAGW